MKNKTRFLTLNDLIREEFFQYPKWLIGVEKLSNDAQKLYMLLLDRTKLSKKNHWYKNGKVYIYYSWESVQEILKIGHTKCNNLFNELVKNDLIEIEKQGQGKNNIIFVKDIDYKTYEKYYKKYLYLCEIDNEEFETSEKRRSKHPKNEGLNIRKTDTNNNKYSKNKKNNVVVTIQELKEQVRKHFEGALLNSVQYQRYCDAKDSVYFIEIMNKLTSLVIEQNKNKLIKCLDLNEKEIIKLWEYTNKAITDYQNSFKNQDGWIVSKLNKILKGE